MKPTWVLSEDEKKQRTMRKKINAAQKSQQKPNDPQLSSVFEQSKLVNVLVG